MKRTLMFLLPIGTLIYSSPLFAGDDKASLIKTVTELRAATLAQPQSGRGTATVVGEHYAYGLHHEVTEQETIPAYQIVFSFDGTKSAWKTYENAHPYDRRMTCLFKNERLVKYVGQGPQESPNPPSVTVNGVRYPSILQEPDVWSFSVFTQIPSEPEGEEFLPRLADKVYASAHRSGDLIIFDVDQPIPDNPLGLKIEKGHYEFDTALGGLLTRMTYTEQRVRDKSVRDFTSAVDWKWRKAKGDYIPLERDLLCTGKLDGAENEKVTSTIRFTHFEICKVDAADFSVEKMDIPEDTRVVDLMDGNRQYPYSRALGDKLLDHAAAKAK